MQTLERYINEAKRPNQDLCTGIIEKIKGSFYRLYALIELPAEIFEMRGFEKIIKHVVVHYRKTRRMPVDVEYTKRYFWEHLYVDEPNQIYYIYDSSAQMFQRADSKYSSAGSYLYTIKDGKLHSTQTPAMLTPYHADFYIHGKMIASTSEESFFIADSLKECIEKYKNDTLELGENLRQYFSDKFLLEKLVGSKNTSAEIQRLLTRYTIYTLQPNVFSDKIAELLMDKIPINLAYFLLTKHMELYSNILKCYSDKAKFIENIKEGDDIHHMGIASALERLIKHEDI